jgi:hypothetical protein
MMRRISEGRAEKLITPESEALAAWFQQRYPNLQPYRAKTIRNKLVSEFRAALTQHEARPKQ